MMLTPHFSLDEFTTSQTAARLGIDNTPNAQALANLIRTASLLEQVRALFGKPIRISSGFRSDIVNAHVGGAKSSQHVIGCAVDFTVQGVALKDVMDTIIANDLPYDQLIHEFNSWIHISVPSSTIGKPRKQALTINKNGTRAYA
jgi:hypothetical protein